MSTMYTIQRGVTATDVKAQQNKYPIHVWSKHMDFLAG